MSFRSGILLDMNISRFIWKQVVGDEVGINDLKFIDLRQVEAMEEIVKASKTMNE